MNLVDSDAMRLMSDKWEQLTREIEAEENEDRQDNMIKKREKLNKELEKWDKTNC